jgi:hypothetical protein
VGESAPSSTVTLIVEVWGGSVDDCEVEVDSDWDKEGFEWRIRLGGSDSCV